MEQPSTPTHQVDNKRPLRGTLSYIQVVLAVGIVLATLFTAWTDPSLLPGGNNQQFNPVAAPETVESPLVIATPTPRQDPLVGIVAGHSGSDSGAICSDGLTEREVNETIAAFVQQNLTEEGYDVAVLQEFDPKLAGYRATALVSIHADSCEYINDQATGFKVSSALANPHPERAARLTGCLRNRYGQVTGLSLHNSITTDMTSYHAFEEIHDDTTAVIIEVGFLNLDRQLLTQEQELVAEGIVGGIKCFLNNEGFSTDQ